ncbi:hypothetical protein AKJ16_DCAP02802 [Drosera capensis]
MVPISVIVLIDKSFLLIVGYALYQQVPVAVTLNGAGGTKLSAIASFLYHFTSGAARIANSVYPTSSDTTILFIKACVGSAYFS